MKASNNSTTGGIGLGGVLLVLFITLKLCGVIAWSWWWVTAPIWIPLAIIVSLFLCIGTVLLLFKR